MKNVRLWYKKSGLLKYTAHLDLMRCMSRAVRRARIPIWYTEGFNPKPYMTFALPLSLGQEGEREPMDIRIVEEMELPEIVARLNATLPEGIEIVAAGEGINKPADIALADYSCELEFANADEAAAFAAYAQSRVESGEVTAEKHSKKGMKTVNLCEMIRAFSAEAQGDICRIETEVLAGNTQNLNVELLINTLEQQSGMSDKIRRVVRRGLYLSDKTPFA